MQEEGRIVVGSDVALVATRPATQTTTNCIHWTGLDIHMRPLMFSRSSRPFL
jgi:hypothetical protein